MPFVRSRGSALLALLLVTWFGAPAASAKPDVPQVNWTNCTAMLGDASDIPTARCAMVPVAANTDVAVIRIPAEGTRIGALFVNPGGPGGSAVDAVAGMGAALKGSPINEHFDLRPKGIIQMLDLLRPIYEKTAAYGHFGREEPEFTWERTDKAAALKAQGQGGLQQGLPGLLLALVATAHGIRDYRCTPPQSSKNTGQKSVKNRDFPRHEHGCAKNFHF